MTRRILTVAVALVLAVLGAVGVLNYAHQADQGAGRDARGHRLRGQRQIPSGTTAGLALNGGLLVSQKFPATSVRRRSPVDLVGYGRPGTDGRSGVRSAPAEPDARHLRADCLGVADSAGHGRGHAAVLRAAGSRQLHNSGVAGRCLQHLCQRAGRDGRLLGGGVSSARSGPLHTRLVLPKVLVLAVGEGTRRRRPDRGSRRPGHEFDRDRVQPVDDLPDHGGVSG